MMDGATFWDIIQVVVIPLVVVVFAMLVRKLDAVERRANSAHEALTDFRIEVAGNYTTRSTLVTTIADIFKQFEKRLDKLEAKLDQHWTSGGD